VKVKGKYFQTIRDTEIDGKDWASVHWRALVQNYRRAPHFESVAKWLEPLYLGPSETHLSRFNRHLIESVCNYLGIRTIIRNSWDYELHEGKSERLAHLCRQAGGKEYVSGPSAKDYVDERVFIEMGVRLTWFDYGGYPEYPQLWGAFTHNVTILDLLFNCGTEAPRYMKYVQP